MDKEMKELILRQLSLAENKLYCQHDSEKACSDCLKKLRENRSGLRGDCTGLEGNCTGLEGNCTGLRGDCSGLWGDCSGLRGDCTGLEGNCTGFEGDCSEIKELLKEKAKEAEKKLQGETKK